MPTTRFKGETAGERLDKSSISDSDMIQLRHKPGTIEDADKGISKAQLLSCPFGVSDTAAATAAKAADLTDSNPDFTLVSGREVVVCFTTANTASNPTLNFAGSGAIPLYRTNGEAVSNWPADTWMHLKYFYATVGNSTIQRWILLSPILSDTVTVGNMNAVTSNAVATSNAMPVDTITSGDMHSITSNAVANLLATKIVKIEKKRVSPGTISAHSYIITTFEDMDIISPTASYIVQIANNITSGAGIAVIGNGQGSVMFFNATNNTAIPTIDIVCIWFNI